MPRIYQLSQLRTILEVIFVVAVVLAFFYWRNVPRIAPARYQTQLTNDRGILFTDTATGEMWFGTVSNRGGTWTTIQRPPIKSK